MHISPNSNSGPVPRTCWQAPSPAPGGHGADTTQFNQTAALNRALADTPDLRPREVERARKLLGDVAYPPPETIRHIASLLARNVPDKPADT